MTSTSTDQKLRRAPALGGAVILTLVMVQASAHTVPPSTDNPSGVALFRVTVTAADQAQFPDAGIPNLSEACQVTNWEWNPVGLVTLGVLTTNHAYFNGAVTLGTFNTGQICDKQTMTYGDVVEGSVPFHGVAVDGVCIDGRLREGKMTRNAAFGSSVYLMWLADYTIYPESDGSSCTGTPLGSSPAVGTPYIWYGNGQGAREGTTDFHSNLFLVGQKPHPSTVSPATTTPPSTTTLPPTTMPTTTTTSLPVPTIPPSTIPPITTIPPPTTIPPVPSGSNGALLALAAALLGAGFVVAGIRRRELADPDA